MSCRYDRLAVIGFGIKAQYCALSELADRLIAAILERQPEYVFTNTVVFGALAGRLRRALVAAAISQLVHMVAPTVWAWGNWRAKKFSQLFDHIFCLFPFEPDYFSAASPERRAKALFVGHPDADGTARPMPDNDGNLHILLLPGSRRGEIMRHMPILLDACSRLLTSYPALCLTLPLLPHLHPLVAPFLAQTDIGSRIALTDMPVEQAFLDAHFMLASSNGHVGSGHKRCAGGCDLSSGLGEPHICQILFQTENTCPTRYYFTDAILSVFTYAPFKRGQSDPACRTGLAGCNRQKYQDAGNIKSA